MARDANNIIPISMAVLLHVALLTSMVIAFDFARPAPITHLVIQATLVTEIPQVAAPVVEQQPDPVPDNSEELRQQAEEEKRIQDGLIEKQRLEKIRQQKEADRKRMERAAADRKKAAEERKERERQEAERKRKKDIQRQREENERLRKELEAEQRVEEIEDEERRLAANSSPAMVVYQYAIGNRIKRNWSMPASATPDTLCVVNVRQIPGGEVIGVNIVSCNGDEAVKRSVEAAIWRSSPLPEPSDPDLFRPLLELSLTPDPEN